jgi:hypothetical protein
VTSLQAFSEIECILLTDSYVCQKIGDHSIVLLAKRCEEDAYYCTTERIPFDLARRGVASVVVSVPDGLLRALERSLADATFLRPAEAGYRGNSRLYGVIASGLDSEGRPSTAVGLGGRELSNDHYPYYEVAALIAGNRLEIRSARVFFYDVAGIEGAEWYAAAAFLVVTGWTGWLALSPVVLLAMRLRAR